MAVGDTAQSMDAYKGAMSVTLDATQRAPLGLQMAHAVRIAGEFTAGRCRAIGRVTKSNAPLVLTTRRSPTEFNAIRQGERSTYLVMAPIVAMQSVVCCNVCQQPYHRRWKLQKVQQTDSESGVIVSQYYAYTPRDKQASLSTPVQ